jgi:hypothetical protein
MSQISHRVNQKLLFCVIVLLTTVKQYRLLYVPPPPYAFHNIDDVTNCWEYCEYSLHSQSKRAELKFIHRAPNMPYIYEALCGQSSSHDEKKTYIYQWVC